MDTLSKFTLPGTGFFLTLAFGFVLNKLGKPYNGLLFNLHKLIALGTVIAGSMQTYKMFSVLQPRSAFSFLIVLAALCVVTLFASGAFLSIGNVSEQVARTVHKIALALAVTVAAVAAYFLLGVRS